jgi:hypothetical protein
MRVAAIAASLLTLVGLLAAVPASGGEQRSPVRFRLSGSISGLYPGAKRFMSVKIHNPYRRAIRVVFVSAEVGRGKRFCTGANLHIRPFRGRLVIPRHSMRIVRLRVAMPLTAAPECDGARFPLIFRARAVGR